MTINSVRAIPYIEMKKFLQEEVTEISEFVLKFDNVWIISITNIDTMPIVNQTAKTLPLQFDDYDPGDNGLKKAIKKGYKPLTIYQAEKIAKFVINANSNVGNDLLLVNCMAGISRSGAVVDVVRNLVQINYDEFKRLNSQIIPNRWVKKLLFKAFENLLLNNQNSSSSSSS